MDNRIEKIQELVKDEEFVKELVTKGTAEDAQIFFEEHGVEMTLDEVRSIGELLDKVAKGEISEETLKKAADGELTEEELEAVAGGDLFCICFGLFVLAWTVLAGVASVIKMKEKGDKASF